MRLLLEPVGASTLDHVVRAGVAAHVAGLDGVLLAATEDLPAPLVAAAALAARVGEIRIAVEAEVGDRHPLELAEEAAVVDVASGGRVILVARPARGREELAGEALDLLRLCFAARPFRFEGATWTVPANLPQNVHNTERLVRVTPAPAQPRLELWGAGAGRAAALERGLGHLADEPDDLAALAAVWEQAAADPAALGAPRARRASWTDASTLVADLRRGRERFGQDWAAVAAPAAAAAEIGSAVRPRVQLDRLPPGLEDWWAAEQPWRLNPSDEDAGPARGGG